VNGVLADLPTTKEATTSRVVVDNALVRVVYFSFDAGQELTEHASPRAVVVTVLTGSIDFTVADQTSRLAAGDAVYLAPGDRHALRALEPCHLSLTMVDLDNVSASRQPGRPGS
jgi:quercetin dioxygenase-like cupin family protein